MDEAAIKLARMLADLAQQLHEKGSWEQTLTEVVEAVRWAVDGCDGAGALLQRAKGAAEIPASTAEWVHLCDRAQLELGEGPTLDVSAGHPLVRIPDLAAEPRWPRFAERAHGLGAGSMLVLPVTSSAGLSCSLNLYGTRPEAFDGTAEELAEIFAAHASVALASARVQETLEAAVASRQAIGEACGILMERHGTTSRQAFDMLVRASQHMNVKLRLIAEAVVRTGRDPADVRPRQDG
ncbi:GAF and ANTAR domain-containing protein [Streptomyces cavernicola]|uniref:GAF and ANTAR domain-containing protein n=1 Tax=Streptomyces cavernicola TaxID=3043613 RepID=A0ABT6SFE6_9ACTN|nr:GAF and ANTAR domain-containing protein [Streptomyces sp. B-S-A6]MDI3406923.1 GAF and ANTAR domain-containing protein [Streptomyces sp. B-S-A6]